MARTLDSIRAQTYPNIEYIIVDGGSTDGTIDLVKGNIDLVSTWISEPDKGIYDAFNKGVALATGDYICFLNSDDAYSQNQIEAAVSVAGRTGYTWVFGDIWMYNYYGQDIFLGGDPCYDRVIRLNMPSIQQNTILAHRLIFENVGLFRTNYRVAADYDWLIRVAMAGLRGKYDSSILGHMWAGGVSTGNQKLSIQESFLVSVRNGHPLLEAIVFWRARYRFIKGEPSPRAMRQLNRLRRKLHRLFGDAAAVPASATPFPPIFEERHAGDVSGVSSECLQAFAAGRHAGRGVTEHALHYLTHLASRVRSYAVLGEGPAVDQVVATLESLHVRRTRVQEADVLVASDLKQTQSLGSELGARYLLLAGDVDWSQKLAGGWSIVGGFSGLVVGRRLEGANG